MKKKVIHSITLHCLAMPLNSMTIEFTESTRYSEKIRFIHRNDADPDNRFNAKLMMLKQSMFLMISQPEAGSDIGLTDYSDKIKERWENKRRKPTLPPLGFNHNEFVWISPQAIHAIGKNILFSANKSQGARPYGLIEILKDRRKIAAYYDCSPMKK